MIDLRGEVAVVTGAGSGLGRELASASARRGMKLTLGDIDEKGLAGTASQISQAYPKCEIATLRVDVTKLMDLEALADLACTRFGGVYLLFNNAGVGVTAPLWENTAADWQWVTSVNLFGVAWGIKTFVPIMLKQSRGHVVNVASAAGWVYPAGSGIYCATKAAVVALSESLANDLLATGAEIGVTVLSPAYFPTAIAASERNRPAELRDATEPSDMKRLHEEQVKRAVAKGKIPAAEIAELTLQAVETNRFYVFPHSGVLDAISLRSAAAKEGKTAFNPQRKYPADIASPA